MPTSEEALGFENQWYQSAYESAEPFSLPSGTAINLVTAPYFLATKLEAFDGRGNGDYLLSHDIEDLVAILDGRGELTGELVECDPALKKYLVQRFRELCDDRGFMEALPGHLPNDAASQARLGRLIETLHSNSRM